jgi:hypothetical protein
MLRIKKHSNGNSYLLTEAGYWIRNPCHSVNPIDINALTHSDDYSLLLENEAKNKRFNLGAVDVASINYPYCLIVSDGYNFDKYHLLIESLPPKVAVLAVNKTLAKWRVNHKINYYITNNPYPEAMMDFPRHRYFPACIASSKTYWSFVEHYLKVGGMVYKYLPVQEERYRHTENDKLMIDDYRNPICAAINLAYQFGANKIFLLCCDDSFEGKRPGAKELKNGLYTYPQQIVAHQVIDGNLYWLKHHDFFKIAIGYHSHGPDYQNAEYIKEDGILQFFKD